MTAVLFLGGFGRSGTTLLGRLLGEVPGVCSVGEVVNLWRRGVLENERCGCGEVFHRCRFWRDVGDAAFGGWRRIDPHEVLALQASLDRMRFVPWLAGPRPPPRLARRLEEYNDVHGRLYAGLAAVSGCTVVADTSKHPGQAFCLRWCTGIDLRILHVVRDSRGVAYSWTKTVPRPEAARAGSLMDRFSPVQAALLWNTYNAAFELLSYHRLPIQRARYEDLVRNPRRMLREVVAFAGLRADDDMFAFLGVGRANLNPIHTVAGNPMRFQTGPISIREDVAWQVRFPARHRAAVSAITLPLLARYGYVTR